jgi:hypothetical protein
LGASSVDALALQPTAQRKKRLWPEVKSLIMKNEEIIALEKRKLDILDRECVCLCCAFQDLLIQGTE